MNNLNMLPLQISPGVVEKSTEMMEKDPHGAIITIVSVSVVFSALVILYIAYTLVGKTVNSSWKFSLPKKIKGTDKKPTSEEAAAIALALDRELNGEVHAAITLALHQYLSDTVHDMESYIITIKRKKS